MSPSLLLTAVLLAGSPSALAHRRLPALLELRQGEDDDWRGRLTVPVVGGKPLRLDVPTPEGCEAHDASVLLQDDERLQTTFTWRCQPPAPAGRVLEARGLDAAAIDLVALTRPRQGATHSALASADHPTWRLPPPPASLGLQIRRGLLRAVQLPAGLVLVGVLALRSPRRRWGWSALLGAGLAHTAVLQLGPAPGELALLGWAGLPVLLLGMALATLRSAPPRLPELLACAAAVGGLSALSPGTWELAHAATLGGRQAAGLGPSIGWFSCLSLVYGLLSGLRGGAPATS